MTENDYSIIKKAIEYYGIDNQHQVAEEECSELIKAISKWCRARSNTEKLIARNNIVEEVSDVIVIIEQLKMMHDISDKEIEREMKFKLARLNSRMMDE